MQQFQIYGLNRLICSATLVSAIALAMPAHASPLREIEQVPQAISENISPTQDTSSWLVAEADADVVDTAIAAGDFTTLISLLEELGMLEDLRGFGRFTVFAPTDAAFADVPDDVMQVLMGDRELMARVLAYHVVSAGTPYLSEDISGPLELRTLERSSIELTSRGSSLYVNGVRVIDEDIEATNGVIHAINEVLIPDDVMQDMLP